MTAGSKEGIDHQFALGKQLPSLSSVTIKGKLTITKSGDFITITGSNFNVVFDSSKSTIEKLRLQQPAFAAKQS